MSDHPILFSGPMVKALIERRKTQTRRVPRKQPKPWVSHIECDIVHGWRLYNEGRDFWEAYRPPYAVGDQLYVREAWRADSQLDSIAPREMSYGEPIRYEADGMLRQPGCIMIAAGRRRQGMHMPRSASRVTLTVTNVRVQRVQEISGKDSIAEGAECETCAAMSKTACNGAGCWASVRAFSELWNSLNDNPPKRPYGWEANPWVTAISFTVHKCNIDQLQLMAGNGGDA